jgi:type IV secretory pathway TraG/TraD family ATPase VirD4
MCDSVYAEQAIIVWCHVDLYSDIALWYMKLEIQSVKHTFIPELLWRSAYRWCSVHLLRGMV